MAFAAPKIVCCIFLWRHCHLKMDFIFVWMLYDLFCARSHIWVCHSSSSSIPRNVHDNFWDSQITLYNAKWKCISSSMLFFMDVRCEMARKLSTRDDSNTPISFCNSVQLRQSKRSHQQKELVPFVIIIGLKNDDRWQVWSAEHCHSVLASCNLTPNHRLTLWWCGVLLFGHRIVNSCFCWSFREYLYRFLVQM